MSFGKMTERIDIVSASPSKDAEGFAMPSNTVVASVRAYREERHGNERWANMAAFSEATALFRFRAVPGVEVTASHSIICKGRRYRIISAEDVRGRGMYVEVMAEVLERTVR
jgi:SPP1 family predicted phage head-tail adaptor